MWLPSQRSCELPGAAARPALLLCLHGGFVCQRYAMHVSEEVYLYIYIVETFYTLSSISNKAVDKKGNRAETRAVSFFAFSSPRLDDLC